MPCSLARGAGVLVKNSLNPLNPPTILLSIRIPFFKNADYADFHGFNFINNLR